MGYVIFFIKSFESIPNFRMILVLFLNQKADNLFIECAFLKNDIKRRYDEFKK